jgi:D-alanine-D-alanine ligase
LIDLPANITPLRVGLVYNQKKEDSSQQSETNDTTDPPGLSGGRSPLTPQLSAISPANLNVNDLYAEWDTPETINAVRTALEEYHDVTMIEADEFAIERLRTERPEIVFNIAEGLHGVSREAQIPALLEMLNIPYSGSDPLTLGICLDKSRTKEILSYYNIPTPRFSVVHTIDELAQVPERFPMLVKPLHEGSSKGIYNASLVRSSAELAMQVRKVLQEYREPALVEEFLEGREFTVAMLGNGDHCTVLPIVEIKFDSLPAGVNPIYSYEAKWIWDRSESPLDIFECPAQLTPELRSAIEQVCRTTYRTLRCRDWSRIDLRLDRSGTPQIIEVNPLPGILPRPEDNSCFPKAARAAGLTYNQLIQSVLAIAARRIGLIQSKHSVAHHQYS